MNGKLKEARTSAERLAAILIMAVNRNENNNAMAREAGRQEHHIMSAADFLEIVEPFIELAESSAELAHANAGKIISVALREKQIMEVTARQSAALFRIAEIIRKLELPEPERGIGHS